MRPAPSAQTVCPDGSAYCILYDADCGICSQSLLWLQRQSIGERVRWLPIGGEEAQHLLPNRPAEEMAVVGPRGEVWLGAEGVRVCLWLSRRFWWLLQLWRVPTAGWFAGLIYRRIAKHRAKLSRWFGWQACSVLSN